MNVKLLAQGTDSAAQAIRSDELMRHIEVLSSDEFEGRMPGTIGETRTIEYLAREYKRLGLKSFPGEKPYLQAVPLMGTQTKPHLALGNAGAMEPARSPEDFVIMSRKLADGVKLSSELVFVGYGIVAPEYGWDDYKGIDVAGKTLVMLVGDPPIADPNNAEALDPAMFNGKAMTYYGRWTYKYEIALAKGAAGALIIHETKAAAYPWDVVVNSNAGERFDLIEKVRRLEFEGWLSLDYARRVFAKAGLNYDELKTKACTKQFSPVPLNLTAECEISWQRREFISHNCLGYIEGSDPVLKNEAVMYTAHWDHFGQDKSKPGKQYFSGAADNASGVASMLGIAEAFSKLETKPKRSIIFFSTTAEEHMLLGAKHYAENPLFPLEKTVALFNMDCMNVWGRTLKVVSILDGRSSLDELLHGLAAEQGRSVLPDQYSDRGVCFRSDHFELMRKGVPAILLMHPGTEFVGRTAEWEKRLKEEYICNQYHKVADKINETWDLSGLVEDSQLLFKAGFVASNSAERPKWHAEAMKGFGFREAIAT